MAAPFDILHAFNLLPEVARMSRKAIEPDALVFATVMHAGQTRNYSGEDYLVHPEEVASLLMDHGITDEEVLAAAVLHDVMEDCEVPFNMLVKRFGTRVANFVQEVTSPTKNLTCYIGFGRAETKFQDRNYYLKGSDEAVCIKLADIISNCRTIATDDPKFAAVYLSEKEAFLYDLQAQDRKLVGKVAMANSGKHEGVIPKTLLEEAVRVVNDGIATLDSEDERQASEAA